MLAARIPLSRSYDAVSGCICVGAPPLKQSRPGVCAQKPAVGLFARLCGKAVPPRCFLL